MLLRKFCRVYGYNNIESDSKFNVSVANSSPYDDYKVQNKIADQLVSQGFYETMANSLTTKSYVDLIDDLKEEHNVDILNALSSDLGVMRQSMLCSGLESLSYNINRKKYRFKIL